MTIDLSIQLLGTPEIRVADEVVTFRLAKEYGLLYYLAATDRPHSRSVLADLFWPDADPRTGRRYLRSRLVSLRRYLGDHLVTTTESLGMDDEAKASVDVHQLTSLANNKMLTGSIRSEPTTDQIAQHRQAIDLYRGDFLEGFSLPDTPLFNDWLEQTRDDLRLHTANLRYHLCQAEIALRNLNQAYDDLEQVLHLIPWHEQAHHLKIRLLYEDGHRWAALEQYAKLEAVLREELDVEPSAETQQLFARIRADEDAPAMRERPFDDAAIQDHQGSQPLPQASQRVDPPQGVSLPLLNSPAPLVPLVGHEDLLETVRTYLQNPAHRLVTLVGMGGVGKTHIALTVGQRFVHDNIDEFPHGVGFVPLAGVEAIDQVAGGQVAGGQVAGGQTSQDTQQFVSAIASALKLPQGGTAEVFTQVVNYLSRHTLLLILDNFEHVLGASSLLASLAAQAPTCTFLVTSRVRLQLTGETVVQVQPLPVPEQTVVDEMLSLEASPVHALTDSGVAQGKIAAHTVASVQLFLDYARRHNARFEVHDTDFADIVQLCQLTGGLPLALRMVAAWTEHFTPHKWSNSCVKIHGY
ncbi:MAG: BTAD domain-containing putative transcriptional regulator [Chloroflexota bacterium]